MVRQILPWQTGGPLLDVFFREMEDLAGRIQEPDASHDVASFTPRTNVSETDAAFEFNLEVPGMSADDFTIELHEGKLSVSGERCKEEAVEGKKYHRVESRFGKFQRVFKIGPDVNSNGVTAEYTHGVLNITVPKSEKVQPQRIQVTS